MRKVSDNTSKLLINRRNLLHNIKTIDTISLTAYARNHLNSKNTQRPSAFSVLVMTNIEYISLGPWCHATGILRACKLRTCSYPFDWCQSGSLQHEEVLTLNPLEYYYRHIHNPTLHYNYKVLTKPDQNNHTQGLLEAKTPVYGHQFFYNPHRAPGKEKDYFLRCLQRLQSVCRDPNVDKIFFIADYECKPGNTFLDNIPSIVELIESKILSNSAGRTLLCIHRTMVCTHTFASNITHQVANKSYLTLEKVPTAIESEVVNDSGSLLISVLTKLRLKLLECDLPRQLLSIK